MRSIPGMKVFQPCDAVATKAIIKAIAKIDGPCYVRLGRGGVEEVYTEDNFHFELGKGTVLNKGEKVAIIATGMMVQEALKAKEELATLGLNPTIVDMHTIKPLDEELIVELAKSHDVLITCEEHSVLGGLGSAVAEVVVKKAPLRVEMIGIEDTFGESGTPAELLEKYNLNAKAIVERIKKVIA